ncbi:hypothetical protein ACA910_003896 [Epithemia clementina (nom. ined.)]
MKKKTQVSGVRLDRWFEECVRNIDLKHFALVIVLIACLILSHSFYALDKNLAQGRNLDSSSSSSSLSNISNDQMFLPFAGEKLRRGNTSNSTDSNDKESATRINQAPLSSKPSAVNSHTHFLLFQGGERGQGAGNFLQGLLAAHLFGLEFNRTVCVSWIKFWEVFEFADSEHKQLCEQMHNQLIITSNNTVKKPTSLVLWNFGSGRNADECLVYDILSSRENKVITMTGNTYPGWRTEIPRDFFHRYYLPRKILLNFLPYNPNQPPKVVVHLRSPDGHSDRDRGLDEESLTYLGRMLEGNGTYLVTNRPDWYRRFHECCGWSYDTNWVDQPIRHGAMELIWLPNGEQVRGKDNIAKLRLNYTTNTNQTLGSSKKEKERKSELQNRKLWSDWYTMHTAEKVYHSNSDFSRSAVHWNADSVGYQLSGMKTEDDIDIEESNFHIKLRGDSARKMSEASSTTTEMEQATSNAASKRTLNLVPAPYDAVSIRIPPLNERIRDNAFLHAEDNCVYLRFCNMPRTKHSKYLANA